MVTLTNEFHGTRYQTKININKLLTLSMLPFNRLTTNDYALANKLKSKLCNVASCTCTKNRLGYTTIN